MIPLERIDRSTRLIDLTVGQIEDVIRGIVQDAIPVKAPEVKVVRGVKGVAELLKVSRTVASELCRNELREACLGYGRLFPVDAAKAMELYMKKRKAK